MLVGCLIPVGERAAFALMGGKGGWFVPKLGPGTGEYCGVEQPAQNIAIKNSFIFHSTVQRTNPLANDRCPSPATCHRGTCKHGL